MRRVIVLTVLLATNACSGDDTPTAPTPPPVAACQANNTAGLAFHNHSTTRTYTITFNGASVATLGPGQVTGAQDVAAGTTHTVTFLYANTSTLACQPFTPNLARCSVTTLACAF